MKKYNYLSVIIISFILTLFLSTTAFANSSWIWISQSRPVDLLPFVIAGTLIIETAAINFIPKVRHLLKVFCIVTAANLASFLIPYAYAIFSPDNVYGSIELLERGPFYTVGIGFLFMTIIIELPIVYFSFRKSVKNKKLLIATIIGANVVTTALVAIVERVMCHGYYF